VADADAGARGLSVWRCRSFRIAAGAACVIMLRSAGCSRSVQSVEPNAELQRLFDDDQADRRGAPARINRARDEARKRRATEILASDGARTAEDFYRAAMIFQHGLEAADSHKARELALKAVDVRPGYREAKWLAAAALDRELVRTGKPQKYVRSFTTSADGWSCIRSTQQRQMRSAHGGRCRR
jgi:hypothetical protein